MHDLVFDPALAAVAARAVSTLNQGAAQVAVRPTAPMRRMSRRDTPGAESGVRSGELKNIVYPRGLFVLGLGIISVLPSWFFNSALCTLNSALV
jgi:hypothetical protein